MQTDAAPELSRNSASILTSLVTRARSRQGATSTESGRAGTLALDLWSSRVSAPEASDDAKASLALQRLIHQVHSLAINDKKPPQPPTPAVEVPRAPQPSVTAPAPAESVEPAPAQTAVAAAAQARPELSPQAQKTLENLRKNPSHVTDPLDTAELLFLSGRPSEATPFYEEALRRTRPGELACAGDRAWILFQLGNCLRETDIPKAQAAYMKLIAEFPESPWTEMARAGGQFLTWYQNTRPDQLTVARRQ
jgi:tetratricopeptide (TPR) repeat protein